MTSRAPSTSRPIVWHPYLHALGPALLQLQCSAFATRLNPLALAPERPNEVCGPRPPRPHQRHSQPQPQVLDSADGDVQVDAETQHRPALVLSPPAPVKLPQRPGGHSMPGALCPPRGKPVPKERCGQRWRRRQSTCCYPARIPPRQQPHRSPHALPPMSCPRFALQPPHGSSCPLRGDP